MSAFALTRVASWVAPDGVLNVEYGCCERLREEELTA